MNLWYWGHCVLWGLFNLGVSNHLYSGFDCSGPREGWYPLRASTEVWTLSETGYNTFVQCEAEEGHGDSDTAWITLTIGIQWLKISGEIFRCLDMILLSALFLLQAFCCCSFLQDVSVGHGSGCQGLHFWCWHSYWGTLWCPLGMGCFVAINREEYIPLMSDLWVWPMKGLPCCGLWHIVDMNPF